MHTDIWLMKQAQLDLDYLDLDYLERLEGLVEHIGNPRHHRTQLLRIVIVGKTHSLCGPVVGTLTISPVGMNFGVRADRPRDSR